MTCAAPECAKPFTPTQPTKRFCSRRCKERAAAAGKGVRRRSRRRMLIEAAKLGPCSDCDRQFPVYCKDLHHRDPATKLFDVNDAPSLTALQAELLKTDVLCVLCHRERTHGRELTLGQVGILLEAA